MGKKKTIFSTTFYDCDRCGKSRPAFYIETNGVKGLWIQCVICGTHARPYVHGLDLLYKVRGEFVSRKPENQFRDAPKKVKEKIPFNGISMSNVFTINKRQFRSIVIRDTPEERYVKLISV